MPIWCAYGATCLSCKIVIFEGSEHKISDPFLLFPAVLLLLCYALAVDKQQHRVKEGFIMDSNEYVHYFYQYSGNEDLQKFRLGVISDIEEIADCACRNGPLITTDARLHVIPEAVTVKRFEFSLVTDDEDTAARCMAFFFNSSLFKSRELACIFTIPPGFEDEKGILTPTTIAWLQNGTNFVHISHFFVSPKYPGNGLLPWLLIHVPRVLSDVYSLTFEKIVVPFNLSVTEREFERTPELQGNEIACRRFVSKKREEITRLMEEHGYMGKSDGNRIVFYMDW